jgi:hypothetical protein
VADRRKGRQAVTSGLAPIADVWEAGTDVRVGPGTDVVPSHYVVYHLVNGTTQSSTRQIYPCAVGSTPPI